MSTPIAVVPTIDEEHRNRLLRRADWRFLLPDVGPGETICFADGSIAEAARAVSSSFSEHPGHPDDRYDLVVALDPSFEVLERAFASLRPGGTFYAEWRARRNRAPDSIRRNLVRAGFRNISLYWPRPDPEVEPAAIWLPLDQPGVLRYYLDNRPPARNPVRKVARAVRRVALLPRPRLKLAVPVSSIATKPGSEPPRAGAPESADAQKLPEDRFSSGMLDGIREAWSDWGLGESPPQRLSMLLITRGLRVSGKAVALVFAAGEGRPVLAVKMPRIPESVGFLRREAMILKALREHTRIEDGVPRVLAAGETGSGYRLVETALSGLPAYAIVTRRNFRGVALGATEWLVRLAGRPAPRAKSEWWPRLVEPVLLEFQEHFGPVVESEMLVECRRALYSIGSLPLVWEQRDFSPWNVLIDRSGRISAVDWESAEPEGLPLLDLIYFLTYLSFSLDRARKTGRFLESYRAFRDPQSFTGGVAAECVDRYAAAVGIDRTVYRPLRLLTWMLHSRSQYLDLTADAGRDPSRDALQEALFLRLWKEEFR